MHRLNFFNPFIHKPSAHEDRLTRAFLVLLRYEPLAQALFLDMVRDKLRPHGHDVPTLTSMTAELGLGTQVRSELPYSAGTVVSVLLTNEPMGELPEVSWADRTAAYDGVLNFDDWTFLLEVKPHHEHVWPEQLNPSRRSFPEGHDMQLVPHAVCLVWQDILLSLMGLQSKGMLSGVGSRLLEDFLAMIDELYPHLAPYKRFALCRNDPERIRRRCQMLIEQIGARTGTEVRERRGHPLHLYLPNGAVQEVRLHEVASGGHGPDASSEWGVELRLWPADTVQQARDFYQAVDREALLALWDEGWEIGPNLHFSFVSRHLVWVEGPAAFEVYLDLWLSRQLEPGQVSAEGEAFHRLADELVGYGLMDEAGRRELEDNFLHTERTTMNLVPGVGLCFRWGKKEAEDLDDDGVFVQECLGRINQALATWGQAPLQVGASEEGGEGEPTLVT